MLRRRQLTLGFAFNAMRLSLLILSIIGFIAIFGSHLAPYDPMLTFPERQLQPPDYQHWLGTDLLGRDVLSRALHGGQRTFMVAALAMMTGVLPGTVLGLVTGYVGGAVDRLVELFIQALLAFPILLFALVILTLAGQGVLPLVLALGIAQVAPVTRVVRITVLEVKTRDFVAAARSIGAQPYQIVLQHILPNIAPGLLSYGVVVFSYSLLNGAALNFLGLGGEPGTPDWGIMLAEGRAAFRAAPWISIAPGLAITLTVLALNRIVDKLAQKPY
jgi:peptide/nickel transport system permease protein